MKGMKFNLILIIVLVAVAAFFYWDQERTDLREQQEELEAQLTTLDQESIVKVEVINSYDTFAAQKFDDTWRIIQPINATGDNSQWNTLVNSILQGRKQRVIEHEPDELSKYGLAQPAIEVVLSGTDDQVSRIAFGNETPVSGKHYAFVYNSSDVVTISTTMVNNANKSLYDLRDKTILSLNTADIQKIELAHDSLQLSIERDDNHWVIQQPIVARANATLIEDIINQISDAQIKQFIEEDPNIYDAYGLVDPATKITFWTGSPLDNSSWAAKTLLLGTTNESQYTYAKREADSNVFAIEQKAFNKIPVAIDEIRMTKLTPLRSWEVNHLKITAPNIVFEASKSGSNWVMTQPKQADLNYNAISDLTRSLVELEASSFVQSSTASELLNEPQIIAEIGTSDTIDSLKFVSIPDQNVYFGVRMNPVEYFAIDQSVINDIIQSVNEMMIESDSTDDVEISEPDNSVIETTSDG